MRPLTLGIVPYLNVAPLLAGLDAAYPRENWVRAVPRELAGLLENREVDVATLPVFEALRVSPRYALVPGAAIGSDGAVRSVALYSKVPLREIRTILLDRASLSSANLCRILTAELLRISPEYRLADTPIPADFDWRKAPEDAFLVIGDVALQWEFDFPAKMDLGAGWKQLTKLPFVFAGWWVREGLDLKRTEIAAFATARKEGQRRALELAESVPDEFANLHGGRMGLRDYLGRAIRYNLGARELTAMELFRRKLIAHGLIPADAAPVRIAEPFKVAKSGKETTEAQRKNKDG